MRRIILLPLLAAFSAVANEPRPGPAPAAVLSCERPIENFAEVLESDFPKNWSSHSKSDQKRAIKEKVYQVLEENGVKFLRANAKDESITLHLPLQAFNLDETPVLRWKWRLRTLPTNAAEDKSSINDAAAGLYVIWKASMIMRVKSLKFTWSSTLPPGTHLSKRLGNDHVLVLRSGEENKDLWMEESVNIRDLAIKHFGKDPGNPIAIAILTDSDSTKTLASADYGAIEACKISSETEVAKIDDRKPSEVSSKKSRPKK